MSLRSNAGEYDELYIDGLRVPGIWHCSEIGAGYKLKQPKNSGDDGAEARVTGLEVSKGTIEIDLRTDEDEAQWVTLLRRVRPLDRPGDRRSFAIQNVQFARHGIYSVLIYHASEPKVVAGGPTRAKLLWSATKHKGGGKTKKAPADAAPADAASDGTRPGDVFSRPTPPTPAQQIQANGGR